MPDKIRSESKGKASDVKAQGLIHGWGKVHGALHTEM